MSLIMLKKADEEIQRQGAEIKTLRRLLAFVYCPLLYCDDGELQDNREHPLINFKHDDIETIERKMRERGENALKNFGKEL